MTRKAIIESSDRARAAADDANVTLMALMQQLQTATGKSHDQLAAAGGCSRSAVSMWASGSRNPAFDTFAAFAANLGWRLDVALLPDAPAASPPERRLDAVAVASGRRTVHDLLDALRADGWTPPPGWANDEGNPA